MNTADGDLALEMETIRPTMNMVRDIFGGMTYETWIFSNCAIGKMKNGTYCALIVRRFTTGPYKGEIYYGLIRTILPMNRRTCDDALELSAERFERCPHIFITPIDWEMVTEGNRYVYP